MSHTHEALSPYTFDQGGDPTDTHDLQKQFAQRLRGVLGRINARIRETIIKEDLFEYHENNEALVDSPRKDIFDFPTTEAKRLAFLRWLRNQLDNNFLEVVGPDRNQFIRAAYIQGIRNAHGQLKGQDISFERPDIDDLVTRPIHRSELQTLYERTYENLESVRDDVAQGVREELLEGFREGENPTKVAKRLTDRVNSIGKHRATMIARSETINAYSTGTIQRAKEANQRADADITVSHGEWDAANDSRVCAFCRALDGVQFTMNELDSMQVAFDNPENDNDPVPYRLKPPAHPNGRCNVRLVVGASIDTPIDDRLPEGIQP